MQAMLVAAKKGAKCVKSSKTDFAMDDISDTLATVEHKTE